MRAFHPLLIATALLSAPTIASAQTAAPAKTGCSQAPVQPATKLPDGQASGTAPGSAGSTGWSGAGLGGSYNGTVPTGPVRTSPSFQPVTAKGLDPIKGMPVKLANAGC